MLKIQWTRLIPYVICFVLGVFLYKGCNDTKQLRSELKTYKQENSELIVKINKLTKDNETLLNDVDIFENQIDSLESQIKIAKKRKNRLVETIKYVEVSNDTIKNFVALNAQNDTIIRKFEKLVSLKDSVIFKQNLVIQNDNEVQKHLKEMLEARDKKVQQLNKEIILEKRKKMFWQATTAGLGIALTIVLI